MGLADREYYREPPSAGLGLRMPGSIVNTLVIINVAIFLLNFFFDNQHNRITNFLTIKPAVLYQPWMWWKFISYGFAHSPVSIWHLVGNMFGLWMFGRDVERVYGAREFLRFYLVSIILCSLFWVVKELALGHPQIGLLGASGAVTTVIILFCLHFPRRTILLMGIIPMPAWVFGIMIILMNIFEFGPQSDGSSIAFDVHLVGAAFGFAYHKLGWNLGGLLPFLNRGGGGKSPSWKKAFQRQPKLRVHTPEESYRSLDVEADRVLDKLHSEGEESLTNRERSVLEDYARRMRQKLR